MKTITERAAELFAAHAADKRDFPQFVMTESLMQAIDEWQASVEERLASIGLGLVSGEHSENVLAAGAAAPTGFPPLLGGWK